jgi:NADPH2:quinone reductase
MRATALGARMMSIGIQAGPTVTLSLQDLVFRSHIGLVDMYVFCTSRGDH